MDKGADELEREETAVFVSYLGIMYARGSRFNILMYIIRWPMRRVINGMKYIINGHTLEVKN